MELTKRFIIGGIVWVVLPTPATYGERVRRAELPDVQGGSRIATHVGLPLSREDLRTTAASPDEENAAIPLREAHLLLSSSDAADRLGVTKQDLSDAKGFLQGRRLTMRLNQEPQGARELIRVFAK